MEWKNIELVTKDIKAFVYVITINKDGTDKWYIGYKTVKGNWKAYISSSKYVKADKEFITSKVILEVFTDAKDALKREEEMIDKLDAVKSDDYYNRGNMGEKFNTVGLPMNEEHKKRLANLNSMPISEEHLAKLNKWRFSKESKDLLLTYSNSEDNKARLLKYVNSEDNKARLAKLNKSDEHKSRVAKYNNSEENKVRLLKYANSNENKVRLIDYNKKVSIPVIRISDNKEFPSIGEASRQSGLSFSCIKDNCLNKVKNPKWRYK